MSKVFNIKQFAFDYDIPQAKLCEILGMAQPQVSLLLNGKRKVKDSHIESLRSAYGEQIDPYIREETQTPKQRVTIFPHTVIDEIRSELRGEEQEPPYTLLEELRRRSAQIDELLAQNKQLIGQLADAGKRMDTLIALLSQRT